jgi:non-specific serine/threonine protein kinase
LRVKNEPFVTIHGNVPQLERGPAKDAFQQDPRIKVFTGTIRSGGTGITLTAAHHLIFLQREWSPSDNKQAISRLDRYGQEHPVHVIDIVARDTKELEKNEKVELKWSWVRKMLGDV